MPYKCAFGCTRYNSLCDACDSQIYNDNPYATAKEDDDIFEASKRGMTLREYLESEENED